MSEVKALEPKERILQTAVTLFAKKGYANTGMRELASVAGVNLAMINYFYGGKKKLLFLILDTFLKGYVDIAENELKAELPIDTKIRNFITRAIDYFGKNQDSMLIALAEIPHDDPDISEHKANWVKKLSVLVSNEICTPLKEERNLEISPAVIGPLFIGMMSSRFLFAPILERVKPPGYDDEFIKEYPEMIANMFLNGLNGLK